MAVTQEYITSFWFLLFWRLRLPIFSFFKRTMATTSDSEDCLQFIRVRDTSCIPLKAVSQGSDAIVTFVEEPSYIIHEVITIDDDSPSSLGVEPRSDIDAKTSGTNPAKVSSENTRRKRRGRKVKAIPESKGHSNCSTSQESVVVRFRLGKK